MLLGDDAELVPSVGGFGVAVCGCLVLAAVFGDCGVGGANRVVGVGGAGVIVRGESLGEVRAFECERGAHERGQVGGVVGACCRCLVLR